MPRTLKVVLEASVAAAVIVWTSFLVLSKGLDQDLTAVGWASAAQILAGVIPGPLLILIRSRWMPLESPVSDFGQPFNGPVTHYFMLGTLAAAGTGLLVLGGAWFYGLRGFSAFLAFIYLCSIMAPSYLVLTPLLGVLSTKVKAAD